MNERIEGPDPLPTLSLEVRYSYCTIPKVGKLPGDGTLPRSQARHASYLRSRLQRGAASATANCGPNFRSDSSRTRRPTCLQPQHSISRRQIANWGEQAKGNSRSIYQSGNIHLPWPLSE